MQLSLRTILNLIAGQTLKVTFGSFDNGTGGITALYADDVKLEVSWK